MTVWTAFATLAPQDRAVALGEAIERLEASGVGVFEIEDGSGRWEVGGYFERRPGIAELSLLEAAFGVEFTVSEVPETDWVAKVRRDLTPVEAGRFFVHGSHDALRVPEGRIALLIEAAMAFGTGHHGTTLGCLNALDRMIAAGRRARRVADIGCGTAVLAMAAARVWPEAKIVASDIDPVAIEVATANLAANGLTGRVQCIVAAGFAHPRLLAGRFDLVFANILRGPLIELAPAMATHVRQGGRAILSGLLTEQADEVASVYARTGFDLVEREDIGDWSTIVLCRLAR